MKKLKRKSIIIILLIVSIITILFTYKDKNGENLRFVKYLKNMFTYNSVSLTPREVLNFNYDWQFSKGEGVNNSNSTVSSSNVLVIANPTSSSEERNIPYSPNYEFGNTWEDVSLPHTYNDVDTFNNLMETSSNGERSMYTGTAWYKKTFFLPSSYENKKIYIEFESARQMVKVYINGTLLEGVYQNGFIAFGYDLTPFVNFNANNDITVLVDNSYPYYYINDSGVKTTNMIPWHDSHWHPTMGGLSDNVNLYVVDKLHLTLPLYSFIEGQGTYIYTTDETSDTAKIHVDAEVENNTGSVAEFKVRSIIRDIMGTTVLTLNSENQTLNNDTKSIVNLSGTLENVIRWSDTYPYLYTVTTQILDSGNNVIDQNEYHYGIRTYRMTTDSGFYLNENYTILNGWGQKSTNEWAGIGSAYPVWMQDYVIKKMKDANAN